MEGIVCFRRIIKKLFQLNTKIFVLIDLKAFERRLTEVIACVNPATVRWRSKYFLLINDEQPIIRHVLVVLAIMSTITSIGAWYWLTDPKTSVVPLPESLFNHLVFVFATLALRKLHWSFSNLERLDKVDD